MIEKTIGLIGCGNMGEILLKGLVEGGVIDKKNILVSEKNGEKLKFLKKKYQKILFTQDNKFLVKNSKIIIIAVKPQDMEALLEEISPFLNLGHLIISIAAGIRISFIEKRLKHTVPIIRVMPNLPTMIGEGMSVYCTSEIALEEDEKITEKIFGSLGKVLKIKEQFMDAVTALSGSGPAYLFYMLEGMIEAGCKLGLTEEQSKTLSVQTIIGAAKLVERGGVPSILREKVTSPGGTTEAALRILVDKKWKESLIEAIKKAEERSKELSK